jgi:hypothetical protein
MGAMLGRIVSDYHGLIEICRQRAAELELSRTGIDALSGLTTGHAGKLLSKKLKKGMGPVSLGLMLETLGLKMLIIEDDVATARTLSRREPVAQNQQRFETHWRNKILPSPTVVASPPPKPSGSRSHLRVVQTKRRGSKCG